jgi:Holliday junction resolvase RusA-like endonuclease
MALVFTVFGVAQAKGNMRAFTPKGMKFPIVTDSNRNAKSWSQLVAEGANLALGEKPEAERAVLRDAVRVTVAFFLPRPKSKSKRGVAYAHLTAPDIDKLLRAVLDALTYVVWADDSQVVELLASKQYADVDGAPHVDIRIEATAGTRPIVVPPAPLPLFGELRA